jgi:hypothetical protein
MKGNSRGKVGGKHHGPGYRTPSRMRAVVGTWRNDRQKWEEIKAKNNNTKKSIN